MSVPPRQARSQSRSRSPRWEGYSGRRRDRDRDRDRRRESERGAEKGRERGRDMDHGRGHEHGLHSHSQTHSHNRSSHRHGRGHGRDHTQDHHHARTSPDHINSNDAPAVGALPYNARHLSRADQTAFAPLFAHYLDLQKGINMAALEPDEVRGRWKSFKGKWNRGELARGWYDPHVFARASEGWVLLERTNRQSGTQDEQGKEDDPQQLATQGGQNNLDDDHDEDEDEDDFGPSLPGSGSSSSRRKGPSIPTLDDLAAQREAQAEERAEARADLRAERKADRRQQKERLEELVPRAEAGTRERRLEKRKEVNDKMRSFREKSPGGDEVADDELVGGGEDDITTYKRALTAERQKASERVSRREEIDRARAAERQQRIEACREKEERTREKLRELARARFG